MVSEVIAIVGGGPAGALAAELLARGGRKVVLFDEKLTWEKPCGGGVTHKALVQYPFLQDAAVQRNLVDECELISPSGCRAVLALGHPITIFSRRTLNGLLLDRAEKAGAELIRERVTGVERGRGYVLRTPTGTCKASMVLLAAGARAPFRSTFFESFEPADLMSTVGYYIPGSSHSMRVRFLPGLDGYMWVFPRSDHYSAGICGRMDEIPTSKLRLHLEEFLREQKFSLQDAKLYAHLLPAPRAITLKRLRVCGEDWAMAGDTAGFVDPITGEGLYYALRSAELMATAILSRGIWLYRDLLMRDFLPELIEAAHYAERFFKDTFLGVSMLERLIQFAAESGKFRDLLRDLFSGMQGYIGLRSRCYRTLPRLLYEYVGAVGGWRRLVQAG